MHMRFVVGTDVARLRSHVRAHLDAHGFEEVQVSEPTVMAATRLDPDNDWVRFALASIQRTTGQEAVLLPNLGGSLPNDVFADILGLPTVWIPHSYAGCCQHAPNEHMLAPVVRQSLEVMAGVYWDLGEQAAQLPRR
jgi:acetylornithine deacetylase/succinyl-diaminopimelate desuccinylase-like protein